MIQGLGDIARLATQSYRDAVALLSGTTRTVLLALAILAVGDLAGYFGERLIGTDLGQTLVSTLTAVAALWFAAPYLVTLTRKVLRVGAPADPAEDRDLIARFFAWSSIFAFLAAIPNHLFSLALPGLTPETADNPETITLIWVTFLLLVALWIFTARSITLLPSIAAGRPATLREAFAMTRGRFWFVVGAAFLPMLPVLIVGRLLIVGADGFVVLGLSILLSAVLELLALVLGANLYRFLLERSR